MFFIVLEVREYDYVFHCLSSDASSQNSSADPASQEVRSDRKSARRAPRSRNWVWTDFDLVAHDGRNPGDDGVRYLCYGVETCPETNRKHHQGWTQFEKPVSLASAKLRLGLPRAHFEIMRGSCEQADRYSAKDGEVFRIGEYIQMGQRTDIDEIRVLLAGGSSTLDVAEANFPLWCRFRQSFYTYQQLCLGRSANPYRPLRVFLLAGRTRCGKTRLALKYASYIIGGSQLQWWDGYTGQKCICIDDYADQGDVGWLLRLLDGHKLRLPVKGAHTWALWDTVFVTTNLPVLLSQAAPEHQDAFRARLTMTIDCFEPNQTMPDSIDGLEEINDG